MKNVIKQIQSGGVAVVPTDTIYGIVASAFDSTAVETVYRLKQRDTTKPCIVLLENSRQLKQFKVDSEKTNQAKKYWPGAVSVILPVIDQDDSLRYLHRGTGSLAFRVPKNEKVCQIIQATGPLIAPSANPQGMEPAYTIAEAKEYFGDAVEYLDDGRREASPSKLISLLGEKPERLR